MNHFITYFNAVFNRPHNGIILIYKYTPYESPVFCTIISLFYIITSWIQITISHTKKDLASTEHCNKDNKKGLIWNPDFNLSYS